MMSHSLGTQRNTSHFVLAITTYRALQLSTHHSEYRVFKHTKQPRGMPLTAHCSVSNEQQRQQQPSQAKLSILGNRRTQTDCSTYTLHVVRNMASTLGIQIHTHQLRIISKHTYALHTKSITQIRIAVVDITFILVRSHTLSCIEHRCAANQRVNESVI